MTFTQKEITQGVTLHTLDANKFNTVTIKLFLQQDLLEDKVAATAILPMLVRRGSKQFPTSRQMATKLEELYGANFGADILKIGERQIVEFYFDMPAPNLLPDSELAKESIETFWEMVSNPRQDGEGFYLPYFKQEQTSLTREVQGLINDKRRYAVYKATAHMCEQEPFRLFKYGSEAAIKQLDPTDIYQYYQELLQTHPFDIFVVGPQASEYGEMMAKMVPARQSVKTLAPTTSRAVGKPQEIKEARNVNQAILVMGYRTQITYPSPDYYPLVVYNGILGGFPHSKLFVNVREKASLAYSVGSGLEGTKGLLTITAGIDSTTYDQTLAIVRQQVAAMSEGDITEEELERTKKGLITSMESLQDSPSSIIDRNVIGMVNQEYRPLEQVVESIAQVTKDQVVRVASQIELDTVYLLHGPTGGNDS